MLSSFTIEGNSPEEVKIKLRKQVPNYEDAMGMGIEEKIIPGFLGLFRKKIYTESYILKELSPSKKKAVSTAVTALHLKNLQKNRNPKPDIHAENAIVRSIGEVRNTLTHLQNESSSANILPGHKRLDAIQEDITRDFRNRGSQPAEAAVSAPEPVVQKESAPVEEAEPQMSAFEKNLLEKGVDKDIVRIMQKELKQIGGAFTCADNEFGRYAMKTILTRLVSFKDRITCNKNEKKLIMLVGPTGVGKTTTLVKLSTEFYRNKTSIRFMTNDTYRVGATNQLQAYAEIIDAPLDILNDGDELKEKIKTADENILFVDTAGRSPHDKDKQKELKSFAASAAGSDYKLEIYLVMSLTTAAEDMMDVFRLFSFLDLDGVVLTKVDEVYRQGRMLNFLYRAKVPAAYMTNGQSVPEDIIPATPEYFVENILC